MRSRSTGIIVRDGKILLMRRNKQGFEYFVFPGGGLEAGENPTDTLRREMTEEIGVDVKDSLLLCEGMNDSARDTDLPPLDQYEYVFLVTQFDGEPTFLEGSSEKNTVGNTTELEWHDLEYLKQIKMGALYPRVAGFDIYTELKKRGI